MLPLALATLLGLVCIAGAFLLGRRGRWRAALIVLAGLPVVAAAAFVLLPRPSREAATAGAATAGSAWSDIAGLQPQPQSTDARNAESLETVTDRLARRLEREPNDASGWLLLAQSYRYLGRTADAEKAFARARQLGADVAGAMQASAGAPNPPPPVAAASDEASRLRSSGERARVRRDFAGAVKDYARLTELAPQDPDAWADLADATAAASHGRLENSATAIARALSLDPKHRKALWLRASLELQQGRNAAAAATWQQLLGLVPPQSNDARIIAANLREARALMAAAKPVGGG
jgi:cytochrome c-type biogenesis protein CcmH